MNTSNRNTLLVFYSLLTFLQAIIALAQESAGASLFDGKTLAGWQIQDKDRGFWRVEEGVLIGNKQGQKMPRNSYLFSESPFEHFEFRCYFRINGELKSNLIKSGIQFRSQNVDGQAKGYLAGIGGPDSWGSIFEEQGRGLLAKANLKKVLPILKENDWNEYLIYANGPRIRVSINGVETANFVETEPSVPYRGYFALALQADDTHKIEFKDITLRKLDGGLDPKDTKAWWADKARVAYQQLNVSKIPQTPEEELATFELPDGFVAELVAQESDGIGKFVAVDFDPQGRMWTMTALDYPVDAKREKAKAENLFKTGGTDKLLVFNTPTAPGLQTPRVFAEGLAIPLGILPYKNGAVAQYGTQIRHYQDTNGDGKADQHEVLLEGFGIEDSHLFPHQFTRGPGGWMYLNQGLGNHSQVRRPDGSTFVNGQKTIKMDRCRIARMQLDGSDFQVTTTGPNNVWGMVTGRDGEWFIQEANDKGYPVAKYDFGVFLNTGGTAKLKPYQPILPPIFDKAIMGGTGLSGLVLAEDRGSPFAHDGVKTFCVANPLTNRIQIVTGKPLGNNRFEWKKEGDLLVSGDQWFRPVALKFGPDGALYVVDWYNKIISHGEVPQNHPERDKTRGRIWRIRHKDQPHLTPPNLAQASNSELLDFLQHDNALIQRLSWLEVIDRNATDLSPQLRTLLLDVTTALDIRLAALWALEGLEGLDDFLFATLSKDAEANLRAEVFRIAGRKVESNLFAALAQAAADDPAVRVRYAIGEALVSRPKTNASAMRAAALLGKAALPEADPLTKYEREFERFLARWAMENNPEATSQMLLAGEGLAIENRLLAIQALKPAQAARAFLPLIPKLQRPLTAIELSLITSQLKQPQVRSGFEKLLNDPARQQSMLVALSQTEPNSNNSILAELLVEASRKLIARNQNTTTEGIVMQTAQRHRLQPLKTDIADWLLASDKVETITTGLRCLRELGPVDASLCEKLSTFPDQRVRQEALIAWSTATGVGTVPSLAKRWIQLSATGKQSAIDGLINSSRKAEAFGESILAGNFQGIDSGSIEKLIITLGEHPTAKKLLTQLGDNIPMVIRLNGGQVNLEDLALEGPFTIEAWIRLSGKRNPPSKFLTSSTADITFAGGRLRLSGKSPNSKNLVVARTAMTPGEWTHYAITRDQDNITRIYLDGVLDSTAKKPFSKPLTQLEIGPSRMELMEFRVWGKALNENAVHNGMMVTYTGSDSPQGLIQRVAGGISDQQFVGKARSTPSSSAPALITAAKAAQIAQTFEKYETVIQASGNIDNGKVMFQQACAACHMVNSAGGNIGPDLSGAGVMGDTSLLRNILTPNASLEASYYRHDLKLLDGSLVSGFMAQNDDQKVTIRLIGADDRIIPKSDIQTHSISKRSLMPEGLLLGMNDQQVADLFEYLRTLK